MLSMKRVGVSVLLGVAICAQLGPIASASKHRVQKVKAVKVTKHKITGQTTKGAKISILSMKNQRLATGKANAKGKFVVKTKRNMTKVGFKFKVTKKGYVSRMSVYQPKRKANVKPIVNKPVVHEPAAEKPSLETGQHVTGGNSSTGNVGGGSVAPVKPVVPGTGNGSTTAKPANPGQGTGGGTTTTKPEKPVEKRHLTDEEKRSVEQWKNELLEWGDQKDNAEDQLLDVYSKRRLADEVNHVKQLKAKYENTKQQFNRPGNSADQNFELELQLSQYQRMIEWIEKYIRDFDKDRQGYLDTLIQAKIEIPKLEAKIDAYRQISIDPID